jgi:hypothetical protein
VAAKPDCVQSDGYDDLVRPPSLAVDVVNAVIRIETPSQLTIFQTGNKHVNGHISSGPQNRPAIPSCQRLNCLLESLHACGFALLRAFAEPFPPQRPKERKERFRRFSMTL